MSKKFENGADYIPKPEHGAAWITGASAGIGRATALALAADGWTVYATARSADALDQLSTQASGGRIIAAPGDVTDAARMTEIVDQIAAAEGLALVILNAGIYTPMRAQEFSAAEVGRHLDVNVRGVANGLEPILKDMLARKTGCVALVASVAGYRGLPRAAAYGPTKAALLNMAEALAYDTRLEGVRVCLISPGFVDTEATAVNDFEMPFLMQADAAAQRILDGLKSTRFEIAFPRRFAYILKAMRLLPHRSYIWLGSKAMNWEKVAASEAQGPD